MLRKKEDRQTTVYEFGDYDFIVESNLRSLTTTAKVHKTKYEARRVPGYTTCARPGMVDANVKVSVCPFELSVQKNVLNFIINSEDLELDPNKISSCDHAAKFAGVTAAAALEIIDKDGKVQEIKSNFSDDSYFGKCLQGQFKTALAARKEFV